MSWHPRESSRFVTGASLMLITATVAGAQERYDVVPPRG